MAKPESHIQVANRNQITLEALCVDIDAHGPWIATIAFYKALHVVEAVFFYDKDILHTTDHGRREFALKTKKKYQSIWRHYSLLIRAATEARYLEDTDTSAAKFSASFPSKSLLSILIFDALHQVEKSAAKVGGNLTGLLTVDQRINEIQKPPPETQTRIPATQ